VKVGRGEQGPVPQQGSPSWKYLQQFSADTEVMDLEYMLLYTKDQCDSVRRGGLDLDAQENLFETSKGKLEKFTRSIRLPTVEEVEAKRKSGKARPGMVSPIDASPRFAGKEFGCFSQNTEDGILLTIFSVIGVSSGRAVEVCSGVGWENNAATLILHFGFSGIFHTSSSLHLFISSPLHLLTSSFHHLPPSPLDFFHLFSLPFLGILMDGNPNNVLRATKFFAAHRNGPSREVHLVEDFITAENINALVKTNGFEGEIDLFSLDMGLLFFFIPLFWTWAFLNTSPR